MCSGIDQFPTLAPFSSFFLLSDQRGGGGGGGVTPLCPATHSYTSNSFPYVIPQGGVNYKNQFKYLRECLFKKKNWKRLPLW